MSVYAAAALVNAITSSILGLFVLVRNKEVKVNQLFALFCFSVAFWSGCYYLWQVADEATSALFWSRLLMAGAIFIPIFYLHFVLNLLEKLKDHKLLLVSGYVFGLIFLFFDFTPFFITDVVPKLSFPFWPEPGIAYHIFLAGWFFYVVYPTILLYRSYKVSIGIKRQQIRYLLTGMIIGYLGGSTNYFLWYDIPIPPIGNILVSIFVICTTYAIVKYRFMDIHVLEKNLFVYTLLTLYMFSAFYAGASIFTQYIGDLFAPQTLIAEVLLTIFFVVTFVKISEQLTEVSEKRLFGNFFQYQHRLRELSQELTSVIDLQALVEKITAGILETMRLERVGVLLKDSETSDHYKIKKVVGFHEDNGISLVRDSFLTKYLEEKRTPLLYEELEFILKDSLPGDQRTQIETLANNMKHIEAELCLPLFLQKKLQGIIVLGPKAGGEAYSQGELDLLETLASQASVAIENARLYETIQDLNQNLEKKVKDQTKAIEDQNIKLKGLLEIKSEFLHIVSHQLRTPLTTLRGLLEFWKSGEYALFPVEKQKEMQERIFISTERLNQLIHDMLTAMDLEGGAFHFTFERVDLSDIVHAAYEELKDDFEKKGLEFRFNPSQEQGVIMGDPRYLREVVSNLIDNAQKYTPHGFVEVRIEKQADHMILRVVDSGMGISEEDKQRLFQKFSRGSRAEEAFPNGSGLGLYIAKQIIEGHKGNIDVFSEGQGKGTTISITLPIIQ